MWVSIFLFEYIAGRTRPPLLLLRGSRKDHKSESIHHCWKVEGKNWVNFIEYCMKSPIISFPSLQIVNLVSCPANTLLLGSGFFFNGIWGYENSAIPLPFTFKNLPRKLKN